MASSKKLQQQSKDGWPNISKQGKQMKKIEKKHWRTVYMNNYKKNDVTFMDIVRSHHFIIPKGLSRVI